MRLGALLRRDLARSRRKLASVGLAVAGSVAVITLLGSVALGLYQGVIAPLLPRLPLDLLKVEPKTVSVGLLALDAGALGGGLDDNALSRLRKLEGVTAVYPVVGSAFPISASGGEGFLGRRLRADIFATGLDPALVAGDVAKGYNFEDRSEGPIPVLVARRLLELYNSTVASAIERPKLSAEMVIGFQFELVLGSSMARGTPDPSRVSTRVAQVVGFSDHANLVGITIPEATLRRLNASYDRPVSPLAAAYVKVDGPSRAGPVSQAIERAGLTVDETPKIIGTGLTIAAVVLGLFATMLLLLAAFGITQTFFLLVAERRLELAILRALGARAGDLARLVLWEASLVGALGGISGVLAGVVVAWALDRVVIGRLPDLPFRPEHVVAFSPALLLGAALLGVVAAFLGALVPAWRAAAANPATALRS